MKGCNVVVALVCLAIFVASAEARQSPSENVVSAGNKLTPGTVVTPQNFVVSKVK